jgi:isopentenyl diphosphate isomerase/L-lactate dehydrogenase-like FMN-dependent dehydrogenase
MSEPLTVSDYERLAEGILEEGALGYFAGGACDERTLRENVEAWRRYRLRPRVLVDVEGTTAATTVLGTEVSMPVIVAPTAFHRMAHPDGEPGTARAAAAAGTIMCLSTIATSTPAVDQAVDSGYSAIVLTVDAPRLGRRERDLRTGFRVPEDVLVPSVSAAAGGWGGATPLEVLTWIDPTLTWRDLEQLVADSQLPVIVKGIQTGEDAALACEHGAAAIVVSNHGGRQLDGVAPTAELLPEAVEAVDGRIEVLVDGGVRRGSDVVTALALGARAVLVGRPVLWGLAHGGEQGARRVLELLHDETELALALCGCTSPAAVTEAHVRRIGHP